ncbi:MAG: RNA polymerase sigma factor [Saprospiraceae bacterium]
MLRNMLKLGHSNDFHDNGKLYSALSQKTDGAIQFVLKKTMPQVYSMTTFAQLTAADAEEILNDAVIILIQKIEDKSYLFEGNSPCTYVIEIAKRLISNEKRRKVHQYTSIETQIEVGENSIDHYIHIKENEQLVMKLLQQIGENCQKLISLKYLEEWKDEEIIAQQLTQYNSVNVLKVKRSECMKKLTQLAAALNLKNERS